MEKHSQSLILLIRNILVSYLLFGISLSIPVHALNVSEFGEDGSSGVDGTVLNPDGMDGGAGETVSGTAMSTDSRNDSLIGAGDGGDGGNAAEGGIAGSGGVGGDATATSVSTVSLDRVDSSSSASGGNGGAGGDSIGTAGAGAGAGAGGNGGNGGSATASASGFNSDANAFVYGTDGVHATARGGNGGSASNGGQAGDGGTAYLSTVYGYSPNDSAQLSVEGSIYGGNGGTASGVDSTSGNGADASLTNAVDGLTAGRLTLTQQAFAGGAGLIDGGAVRGAEGNAYSSLSKTTSSSSLTVTSRARGGSSHVLSKPGAATAISEAINDMGSATAITDAGFGGNGGDAISSATAITYGDNNTAAAYGRADSGYEGTTASSSSTAIVNGSSKAIASDLAISSRGDAVSTATGTGTGSSSMTISADARAGIGGYTATATATGTGGVSMTISADARAGIGGYAATATANGISDLGSVKVYATQEAGQADTGIAAGDSVMVNAVSGSTAAWLELNQTSRGGDGFGIESAGDALSSLTATNPGGGSIKGTSTAEGMNATASINLVSQKSAKAYAVANANNVGMAQADATASSSGLTSIADSKANGASGEATANANNAKGMVKSVNASSTATVSGSSRARAETKVGKAIPYVFSVDSLSQSSSLAIGLPAEYSVTGRLVEKPGVAENFDLEGTSDVLGYVSMGAAYSGAGGVQIYSSEVGFELDMSVLGTEQDLLVGLLDNEIIGTTGFESLSFRIELEGIALVDELFTDQALASDYLFDNTLNLGEWNLLMSDDGILDINFFFELQSADIGSSAGFELIFGNSTMGVSAVPVPAAVWLFGSGLIGLIGVGRIKKS